VEALNKLGYSVQLKYDKAEKTWGDHGDVKILSEDDKELAETKKMIHNNAWGSWADLVKKSEDLAKKAIDALAKQAKDAPKKEDAPKEEEENKATE